eukprot:26579_1
MAELISSRNKTPRDDTRQGILEYQQYDIDKQIKSKCEQHPMEIFVVTWSDTTRNGNAKKCYQTNQSHVDLVKSFQNQLYSYYYRSATDGKKKQSAKLFIQKAFVKYQSHSNACGQSNNLLSLPNNISSQNCNRNNIQHIPLSLSNNLSPQNYLQNNSQCEFPLPLPHIDMNPLSLLNNINTMPTYTAVASHSSHSSQQNMQLQNNQLQRLFLPIPSLPQIQCFPAQPPQLPPTQYIPVRSVSTSVQSIRYRPTSSSMSLQNIETPNIQTQNIQTPNFPLENRNTNNSLIAIADLLSYVNNNSVDGNVESCFVNSNNLISKAAQQVNSLLQSLTLQDNTQSLPLITLNDDDKEDIEQLQFNNQLFVNKRCDIC